MINPLLQQIEENNLWENEIHLKRNDFLSFKGDSNTHIYYINEGSLRIYLLHNEEELTIRFGYAKSMITALDSFLTGQPSEFYIQAIKKSSVKVISKVSFLDLVYASKTNLLLWNEFLQNTIFQQLEREKDILISSPIERYQRVIERSPQLFQEIPHKYIASYLRMTPETLSRLKKS